MKEIKFEITPDGEVKTEMHGYTDNTCARDSKPFEDALKGKIDRKEQPAFHKPAVKQTNKVK